MAGDLRSQQCPFASATKQCTIMLFDVNNCMIIIAPPSCRSLKPIRPGVWHTVHISRTGRRVWMHVNTSPLSRAPHLGASRCSPSLSRSFWGVCRRAAPPESCFPRRPTSKAASKRYGDVDTERDVIKGPVYVSLFDWCGRRLGST